MVHRYIRRNFGSISDCRGSIGVPARNSKSAKKRPVVAIGRTNAAQNDRQLSTTIRFSSDQPTHWQSSGFETAHPKLAIRTSMVHVAGQSTLCVTSLLRLELFHWRLRPCARPGPERQRILNVHRLGGLPRPFCLSSR